MAPRLPFVPTSLKFKAVAAIVRQNRRIAVIGDQDVDQAVLIRIRDATPGRRGVAHPIGASKQNPIEHRLFCEVSETGEASR